MEITFKPNIKQYKAIEYLFDDVTTEVLFGGSGGCGKSYLGCVWLIVSCLKYDGSRWLMGRSKLKTLKETTLKTFFKVCKDFNLIPDKDFIYNQQSNTITFTKNGSEIMMRDLFYYPSDPDFDSLGSLEIAGAFIDEVAQITSKAKEVVKSRMGWKLEDGTEIKPKLFMTCNPTKNFAYSEFYRPYNENKLPNDKAFIPALPHDNPHLSKGRLESLMSLTGIDYKRLYLGLWEYDVDPSALMEYDAIQAIFTNYHVSPQDKSKIKKWITCDPARMGKDKTIIYVWHDLEAIKRIEIGKCSTTEIAEKIKLLEKEFGVPRSQVIIDSDGIGGGVVDQLKGSIAFLNGSKPFNNENFNNLKSQCYYKLAEQVNKNQILISADINSDTEQKIKEELENIKAKDIDKDTKKAVISKEEMKMLINRSPDDSDGLMLRMYPIAKNKSTNNGFYFTIV